VICLSVCVENVFFRCLTIVTAFNSKKVYVAEIAEECGYDVLIRLLIRLTVAIMFIVVCMYVCIMRNYIA